MSCAASLRAVPPPWEREGRDEGFVAALRQGRPVRVETLDRQDGVRVDPFPRTWRCKRCGRLHSGSAQTVRVRLRRPARSIAVRPVSRRLRRDPRTLLSEVPSARSGSHGAAGNDQSRGDPAELPRLSPRPRKGIPQRAVSVRPLRPATPARETEWNSRCIDRPRSTRRARWSW